MRRTRAGFTFAESLAALLFVAILLPVVVQALALANRAGVVAERTRTALMLADARFTEIMVTDAWLTGEKEGDFGEAYPGFTWTLEDTVWDENTLRLMTFTVAFKVQERDYSVSLSSLYREEEEEAL